MDEYPQLTPDSLYAKLQENKVLLPQASIPSVWEIAAKEGHTGITLFQRAYEIGSALCEFQAKIRKNRIVLRDSDIVRILKQVGGEALADAARSPQAYESAMALYVRVAEARQAWAKEPAEGIERRVNALV